MKRGTLVIFAKVPQRGRVKTRLARETGGEAALKTYRQMLRLAVARLRHGPWDLWLAVDPAISRHEAGLWPAGIPRWGQPGGGLGVRLKAAFRRFGPGPVVIVGSDVPGMDAGDVKAAFRHLTMRRAVIGPAADGGYWLIGLQGAAPRRLFKEVRWSSSHAMEDTLKGLSRSPAYLRELPDIDEAADLRAYAQAAPLPFRCSRKRGISSTRLQGRKRLSN